MNLEELEFKNLGIDKEKFGKIYSFVDFGNVNYWFEKDRVNFDGLLLDRVNKLCVSIEKLSSFVELFSEEKRFYYGLDQRNKSTWHITNLACRYGFLVFKKTIQWVKHYLSSNETFKDSRRVSGVKRNQQGFYIEIPKCNFDVEITIDAVRLSKYYDTIALFSGDSDFAALLGFLRKKNKKIILFYSGNLSHRIKNHVDLLINAQRIKDAICFIKSIKKNPL